MSGSYSKLPAGDIAPCRFVVLGTVPGTVLQAGNNADVWGISTASTRSIALPGLDENLAGKAGDGAINILGPGSDEALLELGGPVAYGQRIRSDANGRGVAATANNDRAGAIALGSGVAGDRIKVKPARFDVGA